MLFVQRFLNTTQRPSPARVTRIRPNGTRSRTTTADDGEHQQVNDAFDLRVQQKVVRQNVFPQGVGIRSQRS